METLELFGTKKMIKLAIELADYLGFPLEVKHAKNS